jgi:hypothetical protein
MIVVYGESSIFKEVVCIIFMPIFIAVAAVGISVWYFFFYLYKRLYRWYNNKY